ncbi:MAG: hypothetical protein WC964_04315 [Acholeplasmataceae bacterium]
MKRIFLLSIPVIILLFIGWFYFAISGLSYDYSPSFEKVKFTNSENSDSVFIKKKVWGISANSQVIIISRNGEVPFSPDSTSDFIFSAWSSFLYKFENDTLTTYAPIAFQIPENFDSEITIEQKVLTSPEMINLVNTYKEKELILFNR